MKEYLNKNTTRGLLVFAMFAIYFGFSHDASNYIPAELKFGLGIPALILGLMGLYINRKNTTGAKKE